MSNKEGQQGRASNKKHEVEGHEGFQEKTKGQQQKGGQIGGQQGENERGAQPSCQKDQKPRIG
jgi:hypothetical protein